jgi:hypothetical protein
MIFLSSKRKPKQPPKMVLIDISGVPNDKRNRPDFLFKFSVLQERLKSSEHIREVCIHETGHFIQAGKMGAETENFEFAGPRIIYNADFDIFDTYSASVNLKSVKVDTTRFANDEALFFAVAVLHAAGGVYATVLAHSLDPGDTEDRELFHTACQKVPQFAAREDEFWVKAQDAISQSLKNEENQKRAFKIADDLKPFLFPE